MPGPAPRSPERYHHGDLRRGLLAAARQLLEESGPAALSLREIARRVGVSAPSAYHHFANLDAIAVALAEQGHAELAALLEARLAGADAALAPMGEAYIGFARANPGLYRLMYGEGFRMASAESEAVRTLRRRAEAALRTGLLGRVPETEVATTALYLWALTHGLALLVIDGQSEFSADPDAAIRAVLRLAGTGLPRHA